MFLYSCIEFVIQFVVMNKMVVYYVWHVIESWSTDCGVFWCLTPFPFPSFGGAFFLGVGTSSLIMTKVVCLLISRFSVCQFFSFLEQCITKGSFALTRTGTTNSTEDTFSVEYESVQHFNALRSKQNLS